MLRYFAAALVLLSVRAEAQDPGPDWQWLPSNENCALIQQIAGSKDVISLSVYPGSEQSWLTVSDRRLKTPVDQKLEAVTLSLVPGATRTVDGRLLPANSERAAAIELTIQDSTLLQDFAKATTLTLTHDKVGSLSRSLRSPADASRALGECENASLRRWGIDPAYWRGLRQRPRPLKPLAALFSEDDYPPGYVLNGVQGELVLRLTIGTDGRVKDCVPLNRRADRYFLQNVCGKLKIVARFSHALDQQGQPVVAPFITGAGFRLQD